MHTGYHTLLFETALQAAATARGLPASCRRRTSTVGSHLLRPALTFCGWPALSAPPALTSLARTVGPRFLPSIPRLSSSRGPPFPACAP